MSVSPVGCVVGPRLTSSKAMMDTDTTTTSRSLRKNSDRSYSGKYCTPSSAAAADCLNKYTQWHVRIGT